MFLNDKTYTEKSNLLTSVELNADNFVGLFYMAKNNAIEALCAKVEKHLSGFGFKTTVVWKETSSEASLHITFNDKQDHLRMCRLAREHLSVKETLVSPLMYKLIHIQYSQYYSRAKPKRAEDFDNVLKTEEFHSFLAKQINRANYPFGYETLSSF